MRKRYNACRKVGRMNASEYGPALNDGFITHIQEILDDSGAYCVTVLFDPAQLYHAWEIVTDYTLVAADATLVIVRRTDHPRGPNDPQAGARIPGARLKFDIIEG